MKETSWKTILLFSAFLLRMVQARITVTSSLNEHLSGIYVRGVLNSEQTAYAHSRREHLWLFRQKSNTERWCIGENPSSDSHALAYLDANDPCDNTAVWMVIMDRAWHPDEYFQVTCHVMDSGGIHACDHHVGEPDEDASGRVPCVTLHSGTTSTVQMPLVLLGTAYISAHHGAGAANPEVVESAPAMSTALKIGYQGLDLGSELHPAYANERLVGDLLLEQDHDRESIFLTTKLSPNEHGYESTFKAVQRSLRLLQTDTIDLYLIHHPRCLMVDRCEGDWRDSWKAMEELYRLGAFRSIGVSNFDARLLIELLELATIPVSVLQNRADPLALEDPRVLELCQQHQIHYQAFSVLGRQWVVGPWAEYWRSQHPILDHPSVVDIATRLSTETSTTIQPAQVVLRWAIQKGWSVLPKTANAMRLESNRQLFHFQLSQQDMERMGRLPKPRKAASEAGEL
jgi:diketogulonate reductase-like aldo/keto reductase